MPQPTRVLSLSAALLLGATAGAAAQQWASSMVNTLSHDFGAVARGSDAEFRFEVTNSFQEDIYLKSVRSSCGCTSPSIENNHLKTYETGYVVARFNTRTMTGPHSATLTLQLEYLDANGVRRPGQVQMRVHGDIRGDIVFEPGSINLGSVDQGTPVKKSVSVSYAGRSGWRIEDVRSTSGAFEVELVERRRQSRNVVYDLVVSLKETAEPGVIKQQLVLVTNDARNPRVPLTVEGSVRPELSVAPATLVLGEAKLGEPVRKRVIIRGKKPFRLTEIGCGDDGCFEFPGVELGADGPTNARHIVEVVFHPKAAGQVKRELVFKTDLGATYTASCTAYATVAAPAAEPPGDAEPPAAENTTTAAPAADRLSVAAANRR